MNDVETHVTGACLSWSCQVIARAGEMMAGNPRILRGLPGRPGRATYERSPTTLKDRRTVYVGLDVHKSSIRMAALRDGELLNERTFPYDAEPVIDKLTAWPTVKVCQEAGPTGYGLHRSLLKAGISSSVIAPGLVPSRPGDRVKTDRRDARRLAGLFAADLLTEIHVPGLGQEALRDLVRAREDARLDRMRARHRLGKFLLRNERSMPTTCWGPTRRAWLGRQNFELDPQQQAFDDYLFAVDQVDRRIEALEGRLKEAAVECEHRELIARLRCFRGIDTLTAIGLYAEVGDFGRFDTATRFMSYAGLVPSEHSSGERRRQGSITKAGSSHARRLLIEAVWNSRRRPKVSYELERRQRGQEPWVTEQAWRAQQRLYRRWLRMNGRGKPVQKTVVACARELSGFVWAVATEQSLKNSGQR